jgi:hypothetical protein
METIRGFEMTNRYTFDFGTCSPQNGFAQVDTGQDAYYFGTWANPEKENGFRFLGIDPGFNLALRTRFEALGLDDLLTPSPTPLQRGV